MTAPAADVGAIRKDQLRFLVCGSVDDGKSTLIGRLLCDAGSISDDQLNRLERDSKRIHHGSDDIDYSLLLDGLEAEREQGITIDVAYRYFSTPLRNFVVIDAPGHEQYTPNMATGASNAELAVLLVDARKGLLEQSRRHAAIASLLGIRHVVLAVNKMDLVDYGEPRFREIERSFSAFAARLSFEHVFAIPVSAKMGDNLASPGRLMPWYDGPMLLEHLETCDVTLRKAGGPLRFPVQWVNRSAVDFRGLAGTIQGDTLSVGDPVVVAGSGHLSRVERIVTLEGDLAKAEPGRSVTLVLADAVDVVRGDVLAPPRHRPLVTRRFCANLIWMDTTPARPGDRFLLKATTATVPAVLTRIGKALRMATLEEEEVQRLERNSIGRVDIETASPVALDPYAESRHTGGFILIDRSTLRTVAAGMVIAGLDQASNVHRQAEDVSPAMRAAQMAQTPLVVWLTGLPGAGKSTVANIVERRLAALGRHTMLLDGDNLRRGLNADLGFEPAARSENVRRVGEVAKLMADAGLIVIVALVSPFKADRDRAAALMAEGGFLEVFVDTPLEVCQQRDPKGLYAKGRLGGIMDLTGQDHVYEAPEAPAVHVQTTELTPSQAADVVIGAVLRAT